MESMLISVTQETEKKGSLERALTTAVSFLVFESHCVNQRGLALKMPLASTGLGFGSVKPVAGSGKGPAGSQKLRDRQKY